MERNIDDINYQSKNSKNTFRRMLSYARPYTFQLILTFLMIVALTGLALVSPYLIKVAIDEHIQVENIKMYEYPAANEHTLSVTRTKDNMKDGIDYFIRETDLSKEEKAQYEDKGAYHLKEEDGRAYLYKSGDETKSPVYEVPMDEYKAYRDKDFKAINKLSLYFLLTIILTFVLDYLQTMSITIASQKMIYSMRTEVYDHIISRSLSFFDRNAIGRLTTRLTNDIEAISEMYSDVMITLFKDIFMLAGIMIFMLSMDLKLSLLSFITLPFIFAISIFFRGKIRKILALSRKKLSLINSKLSENISGMRLIHIFGKENKINREFDEANADYRNTMLRRVKIFSIYRPSIDIIRNVAIASLIYFGAKEVLNETMYFGMLYLFIDYLKKFFMPIMDLTEKYNITQSAMVSAERVFAILDDDSEIKNPENPVPFNDIQGEIEFRNVSFSYIEGEPVLKNISFKIKKGESVALVGPTGSGKTSIISLLTRFYEIDEGEILIDGININDVRKEDLRKNIGVVLQDVFLFSGTIRDNIKLNKDISDEEIIKISKYVNADSFIQKLPGKYDEPVMERASTLSSGQRQLLSFARTLVYEPKILVLDEATANIDTETELLIQDAVKKLIKGRTSIAIAHRLSTIQHVDKILVIKNGTIREEGTHQELLDKKGLYYDLYRLQYDK
ncbi:MAG: ABC transporter ATP-binding protein [Eubacteriales bacterium]|uniref:ABC transporter ATP-binding protein n=1 Tax=Fenollaria sp. TaxID=1965292 RepID=UPI002A75A66E|nr:ABC transporter ATP-binding protein [Fenollaria sp.]MDD7339565.1 ABC transporter ATP-binding protein [Eubacteriales bacterium]MDY3105398.1 ABC transporter ATP-binding protein [Fenollaria sp.]